MKKFLKTSILWLFLSSNRSKNTQFLKIMKNKRASNDALFCVLFYG